MSKATANPTAAFPKTIAGRANRGAYAMGASSSAAAIYGVPTLGVGNRTSGNCAGDDRSSSTSTQAAISSA